MIKLISGDLLEAEEGYICQQVNCRGVMGSGLAKAIREKWPIVYKNYLEWFNSNETMLGKIQVVNISNKLKVINLAGQDNYGYRNTKFTSYDAFWDCLNEIKKQIPKGSRLNFPVNIGCGLGGGDWGVISTMIIEALSDDYNLYFYNKLGENKKLENFIQKNSFHIP